MKRITTPRPPLFTLVVVLGAATLSFAPGCKKDAPSESSQTSEASQTNKTAKPAAPAGSKAPSASSPGKKTSSTPDDVDALLVKAIDDWRKSPALAGKYRSVEDVAASAAGRARAQTAPSKKTIHGIQEGRFAYRAPATFMTEGKNWQSMINEDGVDDAKQLGGVAELSALYHERTVVMAFKSPNRVPAVAQVLKLTEDAFHDDDPFTLRTSVRGLPFALGDIANTAMYFRRGWTFKAPVERKEDGETYQVFEGEADAQALWRSLVEQKHELASTVTALFVEDDAAGAPAGVPQEQRARMRDMLLPQIASSLAIQRHVHLLVDKDGLLRGWDVGPSPGVWAVRMRLSEIKRKVDDDDVKLDDALMAQAVDETPKIRAQLESLKAPLEDEAALAKANAAIVAALEKAAE